METVTHNSDIQTYLQFASQNQGTDLHLSSGSVPRVRIHGNLQKINAPELSEHGLAKMLEAVIPEDKWTAFTKGNQIDLSIEGQGDERYRVNVFKQLNGLGAVFRILPKTIPSLIDLGLPDTIRDLTLKERGLVLVTGPTGCGKSTTLAAMVDHLNENKNRHIITIEDPIEYVHSSQNCLIHQREVGSHASSFQDALRGALREDPDVILVGEMRDLETIQLALSAAETGHLVLATLHTSSAPKTIDRIIDTFPAASKAQVRTMLSESIEGIVSQRLVPHINGKARVLALEILLGTHAVKNTIREDKIFQLPNLIQSGRNLGMVSMDQSLEDLVRNEIISRHTAAQLAHEAASFTS